MSNIADLSSKLLAFWGNLTSGNVLTAAGVDRPPTFSPGGGVVDFLGLTDTPGVYVANSFVVVDAGGTALIFPLSFTFDEAGGQIIAAEARGPAIINIDSFSGVVFAPNRANPNTGIKWRATNQFDLVAGTVSTLTSSTSALTARVNFVTATIGGPQVRNIAVSGTVPGLIPRGTASTSGIGANANGEVSLIAAASEAARVDSSAVARDTRFMLFDVDNNTLERVTVGITDSGGAGFKVLRIPN